MRWTLRKCAIVSFFVSVFLETLLAILPDFFRLSDALVMLTSYTQVVGLWVIGAVSEVVHGVPYDHFWMWLVNLAIYWLFMFFIICFVREDTSAAGAKQG